MRLRYTHIIPWLAAVLLIVEGCTPKPKNALECGQLPPMYPDYADVTVPVNIAPLNFLLRGSYEGIEAVAQHGEDKLVAREKGNEVVFDLPKWKQLLERASGSEIKVTVTARHDGQWLRYQPFAVYVSSDSIDPYLTYRLIEPDYEVFSRLQIMERCLENFSEQPICDYNKVGNRCMNCHTYAQNDPDLSFLYVRGEGGGMFVNDKGDWQKLNIKDPNTGSGTVYAQFSPSGRYIAFSSNVIIPGFHANAGKRLEVFDTKSDVHVYDRQTGNYITSPLLSDSTRLETFPTFSPDGKYLYYCVAELPKRILNVDSLQYSLCRVPFDEVNGSLGDVADTLIVAKTGEKRSVCHPRVSPDGRFLLYTVADYGTFPIWHTESDQQMLDLATGEINKLEVVNSEKSDTYHCWSSSGRWFVFASKRDDGLYGKPYFCHVDEKGNAAKPFVLPQKYPDFYDLNLKSYNVPELGRGKTHPLKGSPLSP